MNKNKDNLIVQLTLAFAKKIITYSIKLDEKKMFAISNQLIRSGTSVGANVWESQNAESKNDFIHKIKVALKEAEETEYWLLLCNEIEYLPKEENLLKELEIILKILNKIVSTSKKQIG